MSTTSSWADAVQQYRRDFEALHERALALAAVPPDASLDDLRKAWTVLSYGAAPDGPAAGSFGLAHLRAAWGRLGGNLATNFADTLRTLSARLQANVGGKQTFPSTDFGPRGTATFFCNDRCVPLGHPTQMAGVFAIGYPDALPPDHPLRVAMPAPGYWLEDTGATSRKFCYLLGGVCLDPDGQAAIPDFLEIDHIVALTRYAGETKSDMRRQWEREEEKAAKERKKQEEEFVRSQRWGDTDKRAVETIERLEKEIAELKKANAVK